MNKAKNLPLEHDYIQHLQQEVHTNISDSPKHAHFTALARSINSKLVEGWHATQERYSERGSKRVFYLSLEFLLGRLLESNIINLNLQKEVRKLFQDSAYASALSLDDVYAQEADAGIGNGGLGRLAACFIDSLASLAYPAVGYGIRYDYGIFRQEIQQGRQVEHPDRWLAQGNPWEIERRALTVQVGFGGCVRIHQNKNKSEYEWRAEKIIHGVPYDTLVAGYGGKTVNTLRLWSARAIEEFDFQSFNEGNYDDSVAERMWAENITRVLYPNDKLYLGKELRLKQQYFFVACSLADIIRQFKEANSELNWQELPNFAAIQLNDTHPSIAVVELMRILIDQEQLDWDNAWTITVACMGYTNHTLMPEALEKWSVSLFESLLPRHLQLIYEINARFLREVEKKFPENPEMLRDTSIIEESEPKMIRMAYLAIIGSHSTNGVAALHSELLKTRMVPQFAAVFPERFNNKTNGITQRRFLLKANPELSTLISKEIGDKWICNFDEMAKLRALADNAGFQNEFAKVKALRKKALAFYVQEHYNISLDTAHLFDVQIKRIHEYKRQLLNVLHIIMLYARILRGERFKHGRTFLFAGKAAPGYEMAKLIIKLINNVGQVINANKQAQSQLRVHFLANYRVSLAEMLIPAADISEQISTAGTEASGTGNMKFMANAALTIGTLDGANIEMLQEAGSENMYIFGLTAEEIENLRPSYDPASYLANPAINEALNLLRNGAFDCGEAGIFEPILHTLLHAGDHYMHLADLESYAQAHERILADYAKPKIWRKKMIMNSASCGTFSSDRTIREYAEDIWKITPCVPD